MIMTTFGERLLIIRRRRGFTQKELAQIAGLNPNTVARLEQGNLHDLGGQSIVKLAQALHTTTDFLLGLSDNPERAETTTSAAPQKLTEKRQRARKVAPVAACAETAMAPENATP